MIWSLTRIGLFIFFGLPVLICILTLIFYSGLSILSFLPRLLTWLFVGIFLWGLFSWLKSGDPEAEVALVVLVVLGGLIALNSKFPKLANFILFLPLVILFIALVVALITVR